ncbi:MAG: SHD1 domain-containing protein [Planctomycetia bacterium]|nr:SHD1 domain-containing protein [Planctomycetia bacterium]
MSRCFPSFLLAIFLFAPPSANAREWSDVTGKYKTEAELVAFNHEKVVLKRADKDLLSLPLDKLSQADRDYLETLSKDEAKNTPEPQTWTMRDGTKVVGRIVGYARRDVTIQRRRARTYVNDRVFANLPEIYRKMVPKIVAEFEKVKIENDRDFESWVLKQKGEARTFKCEGVILELESGDEYGVPFFFFSGADLEVLKPGWDAWAAENADPDQQEDASFHVQALAEAYQRDREVNQQVAQMQLTLQAVDAGVTSLWEVMLYPPRGTAYGPQCVVVAGRSSRDATENALRQYPGARTGAVRRVSN